MAKRVSVEEAREHFADVLGQVYDGHEPVIVEHKGKPVAVLISPAQWERYQQHTRDRFFAAVDELHARNADHDPADVEREIAAAVEEVRQEHHARRHA